MANDVYAAVAKCKICVGNENKHHRRCRMRQCSAIDPLEFVAMDVLEPLPKTTEGNQHVLLVTDLYYKFTRAMPTSGTTSAHLANLFVNRWVDPFGIPAYLLTDNKPQFEIKFFSSLRGYLGLKHLINTAYPLQTNGQVER